MLLILAGVSLSSVFGEKGIFKRTEYAGERYREAKARETLETVLLTDGQYEKNTNPAYNQDKFLDELIKSEILGSDIKGDVAIIGGKYAYELDRSVPKIGRYLGLYKDLVWPEVEVTSGPTLINNNKEATFTVNASVAKNVITRIELWLDGKVIDKYTKTYEGLDAKAEITTDFTVNRNGVYTIKVYADLMGSTETTVEGIAPAVTFSPNENTTWKKQHTTEIKVEETAETITEMKYAWIKDDNVNEPADNLFIGNCLNNRTVIGGDDTMTGTYYLWVMLKTAKATSKYVSGAFKFDNEGPTAKLATAWITENGEDKLRIIVNDAKDEHTSVNENAKVYVSLEKEEDIKIQNGTGEIILNGLDPETELLVGVRVYDILGNSSNIEQEIKRIWGIRERRIN